MKKLFGSKGAREEKGSLINKTVQVGQYHVRVDALLGSGGYADIYRVMDITSGQKFALKHLRLNGDQEIIREVQQEAKTQAKLRGHPNVLRLHAVAFAGPKGGETDGFFLLDYCPGTLLDLLTRHSFNLEERTIIHIFNCVCQAIAHMHRQKPPMAHRDLKAENVLMLPDGNWILCDYGSATTRAGVYDTPEAMAAEEEIIRKHTTPAYRPPEMWDLYQRHPIDTKVDVWALGVLLFVLCYGRLPFTGDSKLQILNGKYEMPSTRPPQLRALIRQMLTVDPTQRPDVSSVLQQLDQTAKAITGRGIIIPAGAAAAAASQQSQAAPPQPQQGQPAPATPAVQHQQLQQNVQQFLQQQSAAPTASNASFSDSGAFWSTNEADAATGHSGSNLPAGPEQQQQQQQRQPVPQDWARFSSGGATPAAAAAAAVPGTVIDISQQRAPPAPPQFAGPTAVSTPEASPLRGAVQRSSVSSSPVAANGLAGEAQNITSSSTATSNGCPDLYPSISPSVPIAQQSSSSSTSQQQQQQSGPNLGKLADITARAATAAANRGHATARSLQLSHQQQQQQHQQQQQQQSRQQTAAAAATPPLEPPVVLERQSRPYSSGGSTTAATASTESAGLAAAAAATAKKAYWSSPGSAGRSSNSAPTTPTAATSRAAGPNPCKQQSHSQGSCVAGPLPQHPPQQSRLAITSALAASNTATVHQPGQAVTEAAKAPVAANINVAQRLVPGELVAAVALTHANNPSAGASNAIDASSLSELRSLVFGEMDMLRAQVQSLADENQAFLFRIKQLEQYTQHQSEAMARMQQQLALLQQQQQQHAAQQESSVSLATQPIQVHQEHDGSTGWVRRRSGGGEGSAATVDATRQQQLQQQQQQQGPTGSNASGSFWSTQNALL